MLNIKTVTVVGANGVMGANACAMFASFGNAKVYMISRDIQKSRNAINKATKAVRAESIKCNLVACDYSDITRCVRESDLVFESVTEDLLVKKSITDLIGKSANDSVIIATGTSGLSINEIASVLPDKLQSRYFGMHFFNPPYSMPLLELIPTSGCKSDLVFNIKQYLECKLFRTVIVCKDKPAFVANRIGFQFLNRSLQLAEKYKKEGGIDYIDAIFGSFTGRTMKPCKTIDFVGLDVHKAIVDNLLLNTRDSKSNSFVLPSFVEELISQGKLGVKTGEGLYKTDIGADGKKTDNVFSLIEKKYIPARHYSFEFANKMIAYFQNGDYQLAFNTLINDNSVEGLICKQLLKEYVDYSLFVGKEVCDDISYIDDAMATGFNWCPPLALSNVLFGTNYPTKYDYRSFFKAGK